MGGNRREYAGSDQVLRTDFRENKAELALFKNEYEMGEQMSHPNIISKCLSSIWRLGFLILLWNCSAQLVLSRH